MGDDERVVGPCYIAENHVAVVVHQVVESAGAESEGCHAFAGFDALESVVDPVSFYEPVYSSGGDTIYLMDQLSSDEDDGD